MKKIRYSCSRSWSLPGHPGGQGALPAGTHKVTVSSAAINVTGYNITANYFKDCCAIWRKKMDLGLTWDAAIRPSVSTPTSPG